MKSKQIQKKKIKRGHPIFLGLNLLDAKQQSDEIFALFFKKLKSISSQEYSELATQFEKTMKFTPNLHITTLFIGKDQSKLQTKYYTEFSPGEQVNIEIKQLLYIPERILTAVVNFPEGCGKIQIENKYPHITLATGKYQAKMSNDVCALFFEKKLSNIVEESDDFKIFKDVEINGETVELILIDFKDLSFQGSTIAKTF